MYKPHSQLPRYCTVHGWCPAPQSLPCLWLLCSMPRRPSPMPTTSEQTGLYWPTGALYSQVSFSTTSLCDRKERCERAPSL